MRYYIIAGEASGDLHASNLVRELKALDPQAQFHGWGGDLMAAQGVDLVKHYRELAFMGFKEVVMNLRTILRNLRFCKEDILQWQPDCVIFVDYPGFNLRIAPWARKQGFRTIYYISPQLWAWKESRVEVVKKAVDLMLVILPFEEAWYKERNYAVHFVGHPLLDVTSRFEKDPSFLEKNGLNGRPIVALLPGSRKQEISKMLSVMLVLEKNFPQYQFCVAGAPGQDKSFYEPFLQGTTAKMIQNQTYQLLAHAEAALVTSGTATLETALFGVPQAVCYKGSKVSYWIARRLVKVPYISLVNLISDKKVVQELIQDEMNPQTLKAELERLLHDEAYRNEMQRNYTDLRQRLGGEGASRRAAERIRIFLKGL
jgi:lipid-A-disaccharide synthase